jgi:D-glycero-alpha-D-manno-heptose 1-phosphate guanylyltransferase
LPVGRKHHFPGFKITIVLQPSTAIILAGGAGTRLRHLLGDTPKSLAPVNGKPFLHYLLQHLWLQGFEHLILATGMGGETVAEGAMQWAAAHQPCRISISQESEPLGTGGAIMQALRYVEEENVLVVNGDTFFDCHFRNALPLHLDSNASCTMLLLPMPQPDRYGTVALNTEGKVIAFHEKQPLAEGLINTGAYWINTAAMSQQQFPGAFSWENEFLAKAADKGLIAAYESGGYFIDIGVPEDYAKAQTDFAQRFSFNGPGKDWTLFIDRDGVINIEKENDYIHNWEEFVWYEDAIASMVAFSKMFARIIMVTNQKGVGKGVTRLGDLQTIHRNMTEAIVQAGGRIDAIYFCPDTNDDSPNRKPNPGMAFQAKANFPAIDFSRSLMIGNNLSDMQFGRNAGMHTVFLRTTQPGISLPEALADMETPTLSHLVKAWQ